MTGAIPDVDSRDLRSRLEAYSRYAATVIEQRLALDREDLEGFARLAEARAQIQDQLRAAGEPLSEEGPLSTDERKQMEAARRNLELAMAADREIRLRLSSLKADLASQIRALPHGKEHAKRYLEEEMGSQETRRFDVRL